MDQPQYQKLCDGLKKQAAYPCLQKTRPAKNKEGGITATFIIENLLNLLAICNVKTD